MRIAVIAPPWLTVPPTGYGGTEAVLDTLCRGLSTAGHDVLLYATGDSRSPVERAWTFDRHLGTVEVSPAAELHHVMDAYDAAVRWGAEIVHDHTITGPVWGQLGATTPVVTTNHGPFGGGLGAIYRRIAARVPIIAISHHQASLADGIPITAVIHHGLDLGSLSPGSGRGGYAAFLGRMHPDKGVHTAIRVARRAGVPLRIAAKMREPAEHRYFEEQIQPMLGGGVEFVGEVSGDAKHQLLADATCLLNPVAWAEPFGIVMVEALACGTPVVGTPLGAAPEIVDHGVTGYLCSGEPDLAQAIRDASDLDRTTCRRAAEERFSMDRMALEHAAVYQAMISSQQLHAA
jgi:glycosyltransferase involved in cell wall biosynthesis